MPRAGAYTSWVATFRAIALYSCRTPWIAQLVSKPESERTSFVAAVAGRYGRQLRRYLSSRLRQSRDAPDLAQEIYLRLLRVDRHDLIRNPEAYLFTIANNLLHEHALRQAAAPPTVDIDTAIAELQSPQPDPAEQAESQQRMQELQRALHRLSPKAQATLLMHRRDGYSLEEIGRHLGVSRAMAKKYLAKALVLCRAWHPHERE
jgi:RNA polymerase sigma factor (sigma-70 family)